MEEKNVVFQVKKTGIVMNTQWSVIVDNKCVGKIDFKRDLKINLPKGKHTVQYKVGFQKTKVLDINVEDEEIIVECIYDGTVNNFHIVGDNQDIKSEKVETNNDNNMNNNENNNNVQNISKGKIISLISLVICIILGIIISFSISDTDNKKIDNKVTNKNVELSNTSFTGAVFKKDFTDFKKDLNTYINQKYGDENSVGRMAISTKIEPVVTHDTDTEYNILGFRKFRNPTLQESATGISTVPYESAIITVNVDNTTNKIISINYYFLNSINMSDYVADLGSILDFVGEDLRFKVSDYIGNLGNNVLSYYNENVYIYGTSNEKQSCIMILASNEEETKYHQENGKWRLLQNNSTTNNTNNSNQDNGSSYDENMTDINEEQLNGDTSFNNYPTDNFQTSNSGNSNYEQNSNSNNNNYNSSSSSNGNNDYYGNDNNGSNGNDNYNNQPQQPQEKNIEMPNVVGMSVLQAEQKLNSLGIPYNVTSITSLSKDNVFSQSVPSGTSKPKSQFGTVTLKAYRKVSQVSTYINISSNNYNGQTIKVVVNGKECKDMMGDTTFNGKYSVMTFVNTPNVSVEVYIDNSLVKSRSINVDQISEKNGNSSNEVSTTINI